MKITLSLLLYLIRDLEPVVIKEGRKDAIFEGVHQLAASRQNLEDEAGYLQIACLSELSDLTADLTAHPDSHFAGAELVSAEPDSAYSDRTYPDRTLEDKSNRIVILTSADCNPEEPGMAKVLHRLPCGIVCVQKCYTVPYLMNRMINSFHILSGWDKNIHIAALEGKPLQELLNLSEEILMHPVLLFDAGFQVLAYSMGVTEEYTYFHATAKRGYTDAATMDLVKGQNVFSRLEKERILVAPAAEDETETNVYLAFSGDKNILGYACVFLKDTKPEAGYLDLLRIFAENMTLCFKRDYENQIFGRMMYETFFQNLMNPAGLDEQQVAERLSNLDGLTGTGQFCLGVIRFLEEDGAPLPFLARQMDQAMWDVKPFLYNNQICLFRILNEDWSEQTLFPGGEQNVLSKLLHRFSWQIGISNVFTEITELPWAYHEAVTALAFGGRKQKPYSFYADCYMDDLFTAIEETHPVDRFCMGLYKRLCEYDALHNTEYCRLILTYIKLDCNATHTADALYLHRNTIRKAVQFVEDTWGVDLGDIKVKRQMLLGESADAYLSVKNNSEH